MKEGISDEFMQFLIDQLNQGYEEYKRNHPDFARVVEEEEHKVKGKYVPKKNTHCQSCGEWLDNSDICSECGRINE
jgi:hypothetical protein